VAVCRLARAPRSGNHSDTFPLPNAIGPSRFCETMQATTIDETTLDAFAEQAAEAVRLLRLLGNEHRLMIACLLIVHGELSVGQLVEELRLSQSALSQHLARMREDGVLTFRREAQTLYYSVKDPNAVAVIGLLKQLYCKDL
jgi:ArsR family transcriptional regulator, virulence genes transcriptional regulator